MSRNNRSHPMYNKIQANTLLKEHNRHPVTQPRVNFWLHVWQIRPSVCLCEQVKSCLINMEQLELLYTLPNGHISSESAWYPVQLTIFLKVWLQYTHIRHLYWPRYTTLPGKLRMSYFQQGKMVGNWNHYGVFKPFVIAMTLAGTFSLRCNKDVPPLLRILSNTYCIIRISVGLGLVIASTLSYIVSPEGDEIMYSQALVYTSMNAINITIMVYLSVKSNGFNLLFTNISKCQEFQRRGKQGATALLGLCLMYCALFVAFLCYQIWYIVFGPQYHQFITLFYPYMDNNHIGTRIFLFIFASHTPIADIINDATYIALCWEIGKIFSAFRHDPLQCEPTDKSTLWLNFYSTEMAIPFNTITGS